MNKINLSKILHSTKEYILKHDSEILTALTKHSEDVMKTMNDTTAQDILYLSREAKK